MGNILTARWAFNGKVTEVHIVLPKVDPSSYAMVPVNLAENIAPLQPCSNRLEMMESRIPDQCLSIIAWFTIAIAVMTFLQTMFPGKLSFFHCIIRTLELSRLKIGSEYVYFWLAATVTLVLYGIIVVNWLREATAKRDRRLLHDAIFMICLHHRDIPNIPGSVSSVEPKEPRPAWVYHCCRRPLRGLRGNDEDEEDHEGEPGVTTGQERRFSPPNFPDDVLMVVLMSGHRLRKEGWSLENGWNWVGDQCTLGTFGEITTRGQSSVQLGLGLQGSLNFQ
ncbi:hypothetical protein BS47DRAFT_1364898 [Hydnum rufescens UP504]|uniref:Uncharacterized protein n=1 Tax=Hydnum rufescens UP504 TaxID=1448309 RepID=A0A9P6DTW8_9AGAM|nr:hypothetical protein BS47DRAFT_1364898 [Hydnum rufescens UP504]